MAGLALVIASACVFNNYIDRGIDQKMSRTKNRSLATGHIQGTAALIYATVLGGGGYLLLALFTNWRMLAAVAIAQFFYVVVYGWAKRSTIHSTLIGSIPGAIPPAAGYLAVTNHFDSAVLILFFILAAWQMPHFYAIGLYRAKEYAAARLPILPVVKGGPAARRQIMAYIILFIVAAAGLTVFGYTGYIYLAGILLAAGWWLYWGAANYKSSADIAWGKQMFIYSLGVNLAASLLIAVGGHLP
jgi:protoheme IX farnesyltransferase